MTYSLVATLGTNVTTYVDSNLAANTNYTYRVRAYNIVGESANSNALPVLTDIDTTSPSALLNAPNLTTAGVSAYQFTVSYSGIDAGSIDGNDLYVTGPHGYKQRAGVVSITTASNGAIVATYSVRASRTTWTSKDNGSYKVALQSNQIIDNNGVALLAQSLGFFSVSISSLATITDPASTVTTASADAVIVDPTLDATLSATDDLLNLI